MKSLFTSVQKRPINILLMIFVSGLYLANNLIIKPNSGGILHMFFCCYFNDLICPLFFFAYTNMLLLTIDKELTNFWAICGMGVIVSVAWEYCAPYLKSSSVSDPVDIVCYMAGSVMYWGLLKLFIYIQKRKNSELNRDG